MSVKIVDVAIVGAGISGLYALHSMRRLGLMATVFEKGDNVGGTWYWNRYPGARCDAESVFYSYSFSPELEQEWEWTERFPTQPELLRYLNHVADRFELRDGINFETTVTSAMFDDATHRWTIATDTGEQVSARFCIMATGCLSAGRIPDFPGIETFGGTVYHSGSWPHEGVDFTRKRVTVVGTGSSGIQIVPEIAKQAAHVTVMQRTPNFSVPAQNAPLNPEKVREVKASYPRLREEARHSGSGTPYPPASVSALNLTAEEREKVYQERWDQGGPTIMATFADLMVNKDANDTIADFVRGKIDEIVEDPEVAEKLKPYGYPLGAKRICVDTDYYRTFNRTNVTLVDVRTDPIEAITPTGVRTSSAEYDVDAIVFATGYDAMTGALSRIDIRGTNGLALGDKWKDGPKTYLGLAVSGFPNMFLVTGPGSPSVVTNMMTSIEQHIEWIRDHIAHLVSAGLERSEAQVEAEEAWVSHVNAVADATLFPHADSWYVGANVPGKPRVFMPYVGGVGNYRATCDQVAQNNYEGFSLT